MSAERSGRRLRTRLAGGLAAVALVASAVTGWIVTLEVREALETEIARQLDARLAAVDAAVERLGGELEFAVKRIARDLEAQTDLLAAWHRGETGEIDAARHLADVSGLDELIFVGPTGRVLASARWPERAGTSDTTTIGLALGVPTVASVTDVDGPRIAVLVTRALPGDAGAIRIIAARCFTDRDLRSFAGADVAVFFDAIGRRPPRIAPAGSTAPPLELAAEFAAAATGPTARTTLGAAAGQAGWSVAVRRFTGADGAILGAALVAVDRDPARRRLHGLWARLAAIGVALTLVGAATGWWAGGRAGRPIERLVRAVDAIAAGEADYTFPRTSGDELERLEQAFSRLQRSLEEQRERSRAAERVAAWREVARRVAHEVKNPLVPIRLTVENLLRARERAPELFESMFDEGSRTILEEVAQLQRLVGEFSEFARLPPPTLRRVDLHALIDAALDLWSAEPGLQIERRYAAGFPALDVDADQIGRALKNVVGNAVEALRELEGGDRRIDVSTTVGDGEVSISVCDSGPGLPEASVTRVFEPYFTTKRRGTGLGMAIAQRIVTEHGGAIAADNRDEGGARVVIRLPRPAGDAAR